MALLFRNWDGVYATAMKMQQNKRIGSRKFSSGKYRLNMKFLENTFDTPLLNIEITNLPTYSY